MYISDYDFYRGATLFLICFLILIWATQNFIFLYFTKERKISRIKKVNLIQHNSEFDIILCRIQEFLKYDFIPTILCFTIGIVSLSISISCCLAIFVTVVSLVLSFISRLLNNKTLLIFSRSGMLFGFLFILISIAFTYGIAFNTTKSNQNYDNKNFVILTF